MAETQEVLDKLKDLQIILKDKYKLEKEVEEAPRQLRAQEELLARDKKNYIARSSDYDTVKDKVLKLKFDLEAAVKSREDGEKGMDNITTHREYEALEKQIAEAKQREDDVRKELQKEEKNLEEIKEALSNLEEDVRADEDNVNSLKESADKQIGEYKDQLDELQKQEDEIAPDLDQEILFKFKRIIQRNAEGIVAVKGGVCTGCHMILPAQFANTVREGDDIIFCPYCSRVLFYEETDAEETDFSEYAGSLADDDEGFFDDEDEVEDENEEREEREDLYEDSDSLDEDEEEDADSDDEESDDEE